MSDLLSSLSDRERQVFIGIAAGKRNRQLAEEMLLSAKTVSTYRARIIKKTGLSNNAMIARYAEQQGFAIPEVQHAG